MRCDVSGGASFFPRTTKSLYPGLNMNIQEPTDGCQTRTVPMEVLVLGFCRTGTACESR